MGIAPEERLSRIVTSLRGVDDAHMIWMAEMIDVMVRVVGQRDRCSDSCQSDFAAPVEQPNPFDRLDMHPRFAAVVDRLRSRLGDAVCVAWMLKLSFVGEEAGVATLVAPNSFYADHVTAQFDVALLDAWRAVEPTVQRVEVRCLASTAACDP